MGGDGRSAGAYLELERLEDIRGGQPLAGRGPVADARHAAARRRPRATVEAAILRAQPAPRQLDDGDTRLCQGIRTIYLSCKLLNLGP
eukprot:6176321-Pleurochrysis_carterae.AAC.2